MLTRLRIPVLISLLSVCFDTSVCSPSGGLNRYRYTIDRAVDMPFTEENSANYWRENALNSLHEKLQSQIRTNPAKNLILFLGDGMSVPTVSAARIYLGQLDQKAGENAKLSFENFPFTGFSKTYCVDKQVADSACTSTAYLGGVKANYATLGVTAAVLRGNCSSGADPKNHVETILSWAQAAGKGTGLVTTAAITDASPAGGYSHTADRDWQSDKNVRDSNNDPTVCKDIAQQLIRSKPGSEVKVILGGGRKKFLPNSVKDKAGVPGERQDNVNLIEEWQKGKANSRAKYVEDRKELLQSNTSSADYILGLFQPENMYYHLEAQAEEQPTLEEMTKVAIERLQREPQGYYLFVEGALIDKAHHLNWARRALDETVEFAKAIELAVNMTSEDDTLIVVTADHAHTMSFSGYPQRGNDILSTTKDDSKKTNTTYTTLGYMNGPSAPHFNDSSNHDFDKDDMKSDTYQFPALLKLDRETHGGDDVAVYSRGPWAHLFVGTVEQHLIPHMMAYAAKIGPAGANHVSSSASSLINSIPIVLLAAIFLLATSHRHL